jgi:uncharacterized protein (DUF1810 family)
VGGFDLERFVEAQDQVRDQVTAELSAGAKRSHWMWFVFPQVAGLGSSALSERYAIRSLGEAKAYLAHPVLGARLKHWTSLILAVPERSARDILGAVDAMKFHASMTLFAAADPAEPLFPAALARFYGGEADRNTLARLVA